MLTCPVAAPNGPTLFLRPGQLGLIVDIGITRLTKGILATTPENSVLAAPLTQQMATVRTSPRFCGTLTYIVESDLAALIVPCTVPVILRAGSRFRVRVLFTRFGTHHGPGTYWAAITFVR